MSETTALPTYDLRPILERLNIPFRVEGNADLSFDEFAPLFMANSSSLTFIASNNAISYKIMKDANAKIVVCNEAFFQQYGIPHRTFIITEDPKLFFMRIVKLAYASDIVKTTAWKIHPTAIVSENADLGLGVTIGPYSIIGPCVIGDGCTIGSHVTIDGSVTMGNNVAIGAYCNIGGEGFGHIRNEHGNYENMPHIGTVSIGDNVEILPYTNVDRGTLSATIIGEGSKVDHYCHISHNSIIGKDTLVAAKAVLCGGSKVGDSCFIGVGATIREKKVVGHNATIGMGAVVVKDVPEGETWHGNPAKAHHY